MKFKNYFLLICWSILASMPAFGQGWERHYTDAATAETEIQKIVPDPSGGLLMLLSKNEYAAQFDIYIQKTDDAGIVQSVKTYDLGVKEFGNDLAPLPGGGFVMTYTSRNPDNTIDHIGMVQLDASLNMVAQQVIQPGPDFVNFVNPMVAADPNGDIHVVYSAYDTTLQSIFSGGWRAMESIFYNNSGLVSHAPVYDFVLVRDFEIAPDGNRIVLYQGQFGGFSGVTLVGGANWTNTMPPPLSSQYYYGGEVTNAPGGGFLVATLNNVTPTITHFDNAGQQTWQKGYPANIDSLNFLGFIAIEPVADGSGFWATGESKEPGIDARLVLLRLDQQGNRMWSRTLGNGNFHNRYPTLLATPDNGVIAGGSNGSFNDDFHSVAFRVDASGKTFPSSIAGKIWQDIDNDCVADNSTPKNTFLEVTAWQNGTFINSAKTDDLNNYEMALDTGVYQITAQRSTLSWFYCTDTIPVTITPATPLVNIDFTNYFSPSPFDSIHGYVYRDLDGDCEKDSFETIGYEGWTMQVYYADEFSDTSFTVTTGPGGHYVIPGLPGFSNTGGGYIYPIEPQGNQLNCALTCNGEQVFKFSQGNTVFINFGTQCDSLPPCPQMEVDIAADFLRPCLTSKYYVSYCNNGLETATDAYIEIAIDSALQVLTSSIPWSAQNGNVYTFDMGNVASEFCGSFNITVLTPCEDPTGTTYCTSAHIYPDTACGTSGLWDGSEVLVTAICTGDSVIFTIQNIGSGPMTSAQEYVVIEDNVLLMTVPGQFQLGAGEQIQVTFPATGNFYRIEAGQSPGFPGLGNPVAWAEGCGGAGNVSLGFVNQYPLGDEDPWLDVFCLESLNSFDPNDKKGFPYGVDDQHFIPENTEMEYMIRFQNTGTAPALYVELRDTLDVALLDPTTVRPGASSHNYEWDMQGSGVVVFRFPNINLPDSLSNPAASQGFVKFRVQQRKDLPVGTVIKNDAAIYFDNNDPVITNETWHTIGNDYLSSVPVVLSPGLKVEVSPNPADDVVRFQFVGLNPGDRNLQVDFYNALGVKVLSQNLPSGGKTVNIEKLTSGMYFYQIQNNARTIATGKLMIK